MKLTETQFKWLSFTWGIVMTFIGMCTAAVLRLMGYTPHKNKYGYYFCMGENWGGLDLGPICIVNNNPSEHILNHEFGHAIQNCFWGPLFPIVIAIPSAIRYNYREWLVRSGRKKRSELSSYDSIWFEGNATRIGSTY